MLKNNSKKIIHMCVIIVILTIIIFTALMLILRYDVKGETNMPFNISKISIISTSDGQDIDKTTMNKQVSQNNDIYIYIEKNENYTKEVTIKNITLKNFKIISAPKVGEIKIYRPSESEKEMCENLEEYISQEITFNGNKETNIKNLQISNQGGIILFRCANVNVGTYIANNATEVNYEDLLKSLNISNDDLKCTISFDMEIVLDSNISYQTNISIDLPVDDVTQTGKTSKEITDLNDIVFKRTEN